MRDGTPCVICNTWHKGVKPEVTGHAHQDREGVGYVRLLVIGLPRSETIPEFCWRCSCQKSAWVNVPNEVSNHCADSYCVCHTADRAH